MTNRSLLMGILLQTIIYDIKTLVFIQHNQFYKMDQLGDLLF